MVLPGLGSTRQNKRSCVRIYADQAVVSDAGGTRDWQRTIIRHKAAAEIARRKEKNDAALALAIGTYTLTPISDLNWSPGNAPIRVYMHRHLTF